MKHPSDLALLRWTLPAFLAGVLAGLLVYHVWLLPVRHPSHVETRLLPAIRIATLDDTTLVLTDFTPDVVYARHILQNFGVFPLYITAPEGQHQAGDVFQLELRSETPMHLKWHAHYGGTMGMVLPTHIIGRNTTLYRFRYDGKAWVLTESTQEQRTSAPVGSCGF